MSDISETVNEAVERAEGSRLNSIIALLVALTATFMALCNVKDSNLVQAMQQAQAGSVDAWSYYQAKSMKENLAEANEQQLAALRVIAGPEARLAIDKSIAEAAERVKRYAKEKNEVRAQAEQFQRTYDALNIHDDQFDLSDAALSVSIALFGVTALTRKRWLLLVAMTFMAAGVFFGLAGFFRWSVHPSALMNWLS
jgi:uncharacterized protein YybS (DUF2232 family)